MKMNINTVTMVAFIIGLALMIASVFFGIVLFAIGAILAVASGIYKTVLGVKAVGRDYESLGPGPGIVMTVLSILVIGVICVGGIVQVDAGDRGVVVSSPNGNIGEVIDEGWHFNPQYIVCSIDKIRINTQTTEYVGSDSAEDTDGGITVLTSDNLTINMDLAVTYHIPEDYVSHLRLSYGSDWKLTVLHQEVRSVPRLVCVDFTALEVIGEDREFVEEAIKARLGANIENKGIQVDNIVIREFRIPVALTEAIELKLTAQQNLDRAKIDLERVQVEAQASAEAVDKVRSQFKTDEAYLQYILYSQLKDMDDVQIILSDNGTSTVKVI